jgi:hypothetical protein
MTDRSDAIDSPAQRAEAARARNGPNWWYRTGRPGLPKSFILVGALAMGWCAKGATRADSAATGGGGGQR